MIVGCGGLGSTCSTILSRSGVGRLILIDCDEVSLSNIHRQFLYTQDDIGKPKSKTAASSSLLCLSNNIPIISHIDKDTAYQLIEEYHPCVVMDCTDNFEVRYAINHACVRASVPMVFGSITADQGQVSVFCDSQSDPDCPCFSCIHPLPPQQMPSPPPVVPGICSIVGTFPAQQAISIITGVGDKLARELLTIDMLKMKMRRFRLRERNPNCAVCGIGEKPSQ